VRRSPATTAPSCQGLPRRRRRRTRGGHPRPYGSLNWSANQSWTRIPADSALRIVGDLDALREIIPRELYELVLDAVNQPTIEDLDI
jgi:EXLDI family protein